MSVSSSLFEKLGADILARMFEVAAHGLALVNGSGQFMHINAVGCAILARPYDELVGSDFGESIEPRERENAVNWFDRSLSGKPLKRDFDVRRRHGRERLASFFCVPVILEDRTAGLMAFHDVTVARRAEFEARTLAALSSSLARETSVNAISRLLTQQVVDTTPSVASAVILLSPNGAEGRVAGSNGLPDRFLDIFEQSFLRDPERLRERMPQAGEVRVLPDLRNTYQDRWGLEQFEALEGEVSWDTLACVPLTYLGRLTGALFAYYADGYAPSEVDLRFLGTIADQSVFAIENARLLTEVQDKAALEERQRLARELHDSVSQALYGIALGTRSARSQLGRDTERAAERLDYVMNMAEAAISEMRALIFELRPESLEAEGLIVAVAKQASAMHARHGIMVETILGEEPPLQFAAKQALYRIVQEALHNIVKHARASRVGLGLSQKGSSMVLDINDDGVGFDPQATFTGHLGLSSMRERAEALGGTFQVTSSPGKGTRLHLEVPI